jgi:hypothetical protein
VGGEAGGAGGRVTDGGQRDVARAGHGERGWREHRDREGGDRRWPQRTVALSRDVRARSLELTGSRTRAGWEARSPFVRDREQIPHIGRGIP